MKINNDQITISKWQKLQFDLKRGSGHLFPYLLNRLRWHYYPQFQYVSRFPDHVDVEISSVCNMQCPMCYTTTDKFKLNVKRTLMDMPLFKKIIDECARYGIYSIRLSLRGEPFIHKNIIEMIRYAKDKGIKEISCLTNMLNLTPELFKQTMEAGLDWLTISFDGLGETYEKIRKPAKFSEAFAKIQEYKRIKDNAHSIKPVIKIQTVWPAIKDNAKEYYDTFDPLVDNIAVNSLIDYLGKDEDIIYEENFVCQALYQRFVIAADGLALLCHNDEFCLDPIGDINKNSIYELWHGNKMTSAREAHHRHKGVQEIKMCKECYLPRKTEPVIEKFGGDDLVVDKYINRPEIVGQ